MYGNITDLSIVIETVENKDELIPNVNIPDRILNEDISKIIAICSPNFVQIRKGRDQKTLFCKVIHKKCQAKGHCGSTLLARLTCFSAIWH